MDKFKWQVLLGVGSNIITIMIASAIPDRLLIIISIILLVLSLVSVMIFDFTKHPSVGVHLMLLAYLMCFIYGSFTHLAFLPIILICPIIIGLAYIYFLSKIIRIAYILSCSVGGVIIVINTNLLLVENHNTFIILASIAILMGVLVVYITIFTINSNLLNSYQKKLLQNEKTLSHKNEELLKYIQSNLQLENFAYLASHELRTPLRNISNLSGLLQKKLKNIIPVNDMDSFAILEKEVKRLNQLVSDLLELAHAKNEELILERINLNDLLNEIIRKNFNTSKSEFTFQLEVDTVVGNLKFLYQLFINLIENAIKFKRNDSNVVLLFESVSGDDFIDINIHDNGIGILPEYRENVFLIFKRLHNLEEYEGTGMGLAMCKTIVEKHGGQIKAKESKLGGTCISVRLPKQKISTLKIS